MNIPPHAERPDEELPTGPDEGTGPTGPGRPQGPTGRPAPPCHCRRPVVDFRDPHGDGDPRCTHCGRSVPAAARRSA